MSYGINVIQVVPLFCLNKIRCCKASNVFDDLRCVYTIYTALACFKKCNMAEINYHHARKNENFHFFQL